MDRENRIERIRAKMNNESVVEENGEKFDVILTSVGYDKIQTIKTIREVARNDVSQAKAIADSCPAVIESNVSKERAITIKRKFDEIGAQVSVECSKQDRYIDNIKPKQQSNIIRITRKSQLNGGGAKIRIYIDGDYYCNIDCGQTVSFKSNVGRSMSFRFDAADGKHWSDEYAIPKDDTSHSYQLYVKSRLFSVDVLLREI